MSPMYHNSAETCTMTLQYYISGDMGTVDEGTDPTGLSNIPPSDPMIQLSILLYFSGCIA